MIFMAETYIQMLFENNKSFDKFIQAIKQRLSVYPISYIHAEDYKPSAVSMLFVNINDEPYVFLTQRSNQVSHHKGQVAFPGGRVDDTDANVLEAAIREVYEETGIPNEAIEYLGRFDDYLTTTKYHVACFIGIIKETINYKLSEFEVDGCFEVPFSIFANKEYTSTEMGELAGKPSIIYHYHYKDHHIWGLTARILTEFAVKIFDGNQNVSN